MKQLEKKYKQLLEDVRNDRAKLSKYSYDLSIDKTGNQKSRKRLLISLLNFKEDSDYDIASYLFNEEIKVLHDLDQIDDHDIDTLDLSVLILTSFNNVEDILKMVSGGRDSDEEYVYIEAEYYAFYGYEKCQNFLNSSSDPRAKIALEEFNGISEDDVEFMQLKSDDLIRAFFFPLESKSLMLFCIDMKETEILSQEANKWFDTVQDWNEGNIRVGKAISSLVGDDHPFNKRIKGQQRQFFERQNQIQQQDAEDDAASKNTNILGVIFFVLLFIVMLGISMMTTVFFSLEADNMNQRFGLWAVSLITAFLAAFTIKGLKATNTNDLEHFKKEYLSGKRTPLLSWEYLDNRWGNHAQEKFEKIKKLQQKTLAAFVIVSVGLCLLAFDPVLLAVIVWISVIVIIFFFINIRKGYLVYRDAYLHTQPATLDIYDRGMVVGKKHYVPFNTRYIWLRGTKLVMKEGIPYLEIETNPRGGKYPDANIVYHLVPVPSGKEDEAKNISLAIK